MRRPLDAVVAVTYRCNARCAMCGIWRAQSGPELPAAEYRKLPASLLDVNLTGGEPFLRDDLAAVHEAVKSASPRARTVISTNGLLTGRIVSAVREIARVEPEIGIAVSLDGPAEVHDRLRGVKGAYGRAVATIRALQDAGFTNLRLAFTATRRNLEHLEKTYRLARELRVEFTCAVQHGSAHYFRVPSPEERLHPDELARQLEPVIRSELRALSPKRWARAYFLCGMYEYAVRGGRILPCRAGEDFFFMDPSGDVYTCNAAPYRMGNIVGREFDELWRSPEAEEARRKAAVCGGCWMVCTARASMRRAWPRVLAWVLLHRLVGVSLSRRAP